MEVLAGWLRINKVPLVFYIIFRKEKSRCWGIPNTGRRPETLPKQFSHRFPKLHQALRAIGEELSGRYFHTDYSVPTGTLDLPAELGQWQDACSRKQGSSFVSECRITVLEVDLSDVCAERSPQLHEEIAQLRRVFWQSADPDNTLRVLEHVLGVEYDR